MRRLGATSVIANVMVVVCPNVAKAEDTRSGESAEGGTPTEEQPRTPEGDDNIDALVETHLAR